ncbi:MAG: hypothetical protein JXB88_11700 [Spirochaetales bacterium]|nr:hypothetical protein [Spirochaetales bacterium]
MKYICQTRCEGDKIYTKPDKCPECGMPLIAVQKDTDPVKENHDKHRVVPAS